uniref:Uncharacterized protein n=1 Tax=Panagrolaimus sp. ES5 TaxID=591445 RepID=A0AC34G3B7_9BILA
MKTLIIFNCIFCLTAADFLNSTVVLFDTNGSELGYGIIVAEQTILLPSVEIYQNLETFAYLFEYNENPQRSIKYSILSQNFTELDDATFVLKLSNEGNDTRILGDARILRISRYPFCDKTNILKTLEKTAGRFAPNQVQPKNFSSWTCNNETKKVCGYMKAGSKAGTPLVNEIDDLNYLVGLLDHQNSGTFNLLTQKCEVLPIFDSCNFALPLITAFTFCNAMEISRNLNASGHSEMILIGTAEINLPTTFVPSGFAVIVDERHVIVFSDFKNVEKEIANFEIYGNGRETEVAIMDKTEVHFPGKYETIETTIINIKILKVF